MCSKYNCEEILLQGLYLNDKKFNKNRWLEPSHGRQKGRPKKVQKMSKP
jgi:hypothetical protein